MSIDNGNAEELHADSYFHCYLLRSRDPKYPNKTYVGFTVNPWRRIRQHNGILKHGGAWRTKRGGRPWEFAVVIHGFPSQRSALQFEWAWQHCDKSLAVRAILGDVAAKTLKRKRALKGQLWILKTLVSSCPALFRHQSLSLFFFDDTTRQMYESIHLNPVPTTVSMDWIVEARVVSSLQDMPFWLTRKKGGKRKQLPKTVGREEALTKRNIENFNVRSTHHGNEKADESSHPQKHQKHLSCTFCHRPILPHEAPSGRYSNTSYAMHEICRDLYFEEDDEEKSWKNDRSTLDTSILGCSIEDEDDLSLYLSKQTKEDQKTTLISAGHHSGWDDSDTDSDESYPSFQVDISDSESCQSPHSPHLDVGGSKCTTDPSLKLSSFASMNITPQNKFQSVSRDLSAYSPISTLNDDSIECIELEEDSTHSGGHVIPSKSQCSLEIVDLCSP